MTITPGTDTALVLRSAIEGSRRLLAATIAGICSGLLFHATFSALGLSAILKTSAELYSALKLAGAGYLIYLGARALYEAAREKFKKSSIESGLATASLKSVAGEFRTGLMTNLLNPKVAVFYLTFLPQFMDPSQALFAQALMLSLGHILMSIVWLALIGMFVAYFKRQLERPNVRSAIEIATGLTFLGFGLRLAF